MELPVNIGAILSRLRLGANASQANVAAKAGMDQSRVSRLENGDLSPTAEEIEAYLSSLGTEEASSYLLNLQRPWAFLEIPSPENPDIDAIVKAEEQLVRLQTFEEERNPPAPVRAEIELYRQSLLAGGDYLGRLDHSIAFIGTVGVGKTTALSLASDLAIPGKAAGLGQRVVLETGSGRVTLCEVEVKAGPALGVLVQASPGDEIYRLVDDVCHDIFCDAGLAPAETRRGVPREIRRALRNLADLANAFEVTPQGKVLVDKALKLAKEIAEKGGTVEDLQSEFAARLQLWKRTKTELWYDADGKVTAKQWLRDVFAKVNKGLLPDVSLPEKIDVLVPDRLLRQSTYQLSVVDTRGLDETTTRPDLRIRLEDQRTVTFLCSDFDAAPDAGTRGLVQHALETGLNSAVADRMALLILPRAGEAQATSDDSGAAADTDEEGYAIKLDQVKSVLHSLKAEGMPVLFFNAGTDDAELLAEQLVDVVRRMRLRQSEKVSAVANAIDGLVANYEMQSAELIRRKALRALAGFLDSHASLGVAINPAHSLLLTEMNRSAAPTVWAMARRQGGWYNFNVYSHLGDGVTREASRRSQEFFTSLTGRIESMLEDEDFQPVHAFLSQVLVNAEQRREAFLKASHTLGQMTFRPALQDALGLWARCEDRWGRGSGFREDVVSEIREWFEAVERQLLHTALEGRIKAAWLAEVVEPLRGIVAGEGAD